MIKKTYKIFELKKEYYNTYSANYVFGSVFVPVDELETKEQCEQVIESMGLWGEQYAIVEVWERVNE